MPPKKQTTSSLVSALSFVVKAQQQAGTPIQTHCCIKNQQITAFNGMISVGHSIEEDLNVCPHTYSFLNAMQKCGPEYSITQQNGKLTVKSGKFTCQIPCLPDDLTPSVTDASCASISDDLLKSLGQVSSLAQEAAQKVILSSVLIKDFSCFATTGYVIKQSFHGINLPVIALPKLFVTALCSTDKKVVGFGFSEAKVNNVLTPNSATFYFEDGSWLKTQLYAEQWPDLNRMLACEIEPSSLPEGFFEAVRNVEDFSVGKKDKKVWLSQNGVSSHKDQTEGAFYEMKGLPEIAFKIEQLKQVEDCCDKVVFNDGKLYAFKDKVRAIVMGVKG